MSLKKGRRLSFQRDRTKLQYAVMGAFVIKICHDTGIPLVDDVTHLHNDICATLDVTPSLV